MKIIIFDTETTGLLKPSPTPLFKQPYIIEFFGYAIDENFEFIDSFESLFKIDFPLDPFITKLTRIEDSDLENQLSFKEKVEELKNFFSGSNIVAAHNLSFDKGMMMNELSRCELPYEFPWPENGEICTIEKSMKIRGHRLKLSQLHEELFDKSFRNAHRAKSDVDALTRCFIKLCEKEYINLEDYL